MNLNLQKPTYPFRPIGTVEALAKTLRTEVATLESIAAVADSLYRPVKPKPGSTRQVFDAKDRLKPIHTKIKNLILSKVVFPPYLTGSLKGRDYKVNATLHANQAVIICEDVKGFFGSVSSERVYDIWHGFFRFPPKVAALLTRLCTKDGSLPQGAIPSSYLANLALWRDEPFLQAKLNARGVVYSRYVDDIGISSKTILSRKDKTDLIASVYGMLSKNGLSAKREKHEIHPATERMIATKLVINRKAALTPERRANARTVVFQVEQLAASGATDEQVLEAATKASNRLGLVGRFHPNIAAPLKERIRKIKHAISLPKEANQSGALGHEPPENLCPVSS